jgi:hypothetical protein
MAVLSATGEVLMEQREALQFNYATRSPVLDVFATNTLTLDPNTPPGIHSFRITLRDRLRDAESVELVTFEVI